MDDYVYMKDLQLIVENFLKVVYIVNCYVKIVFNFKYLYLLKKWVL